ncbi:MAG: hypothetical protein H6832_04820 [Planctomycetes bacterium]|nr:hypothetical protein [Planctomycetota bacterium]MCB9890463.1 hypothetical protein [Planctomycetota bacterium]MCB9917704.1 hypothetical protein [Planctomycetota bacterium]
MERSLDVSRSHGPALSRKIELALEKAHRHDTAEEANAEGPWRIAGGLVLVAIGIVFGVALARLHWGYDGNVDARGVGQNFVLSIYRGVGFAPALYFFLLVTVWGLLAFFGTSVRASLRRLAIAVVFVLAFASLAGTLGGNGGEFGSWVSGRLMAAIGTVPAFLILGALAVMALLLATDWFFFSQFRSGHLDFWRDTESRSAAGRGEGRMPRASVTFRPSEATGETLRPVPVSRDARGFEATRSESEVAAQRERDMVDRVLAEARLELSATAVAEPGAPSGSSAGTLEFDEDEALDEASGEDSDDSIEARRLARRARREALRAAREDDDDVSDVLHVDTRVEAEFSTASASIAGALHEDEDEDEDEDGIRVADEPRVVIHGPETTVDPDPYHFDGLHPDEELGLAGLLDGGPLSMDDEDLLAKAGEALEKQWQGGGVGFGPLRLSGQTSGNEKAESGRSDDVTSARTPGDRSSSDRSHSERGMSGTEPGGMHSSQRDEPRGEGPAKSDPFAAAPDRRLGDEQESSLLQPQPSRRPVPEIESTPSGRESKPELPSGLRQGSLFDDFLQIGESPVTPAETSTPVDTGASDEVATPTDAGAHAETAAPEKDSATGESVTANETDHIDRSSEPVTWTDARPRDDHEVSLDAAGLARLDAAAEIVLSVRRPTPSLLQRRLGVDGLVARGLLDRLAELGAVEEPDDGGAWYPLLSVEEWRASRARP